jgi:predicted AAA+ superfamily ATPase
MFPRWLDLDRKRSVLLVGPRRAGKTTFLRTNFPGYTYVTLDDFDYLDLARSDPKGFVLRLGRQAIIDEIQRHPPLTIAIKFAIDNDASQFLMSGSSTLGLLDASADTLAGRIDIVSLPTACWGEEKGPPTHDIFREEADRLQIREANRWLPDALRFGQFPELLGLAQVEDKRLLLRNYRDTYFVRDLMQLANLENAEGLRGVFLHLARALGSHLEVSSFAREAGLSFPTTKKYLNALSQSQLVFKLYGYQYGPAKRFLKSAKSYFADVGVLQSLNAEPHHGQVVENFVLAELEKRRKLGFIQTEQFFFYKSQGGLEIDCIWETEEGITAVEVKASSKVSAPDARRLRAFVTGSSRPCRGYLFYMGTDYMNFGGIRAIPVAALYRGR